MKSSLRIAAVTVRELLHEKVVYLILSFAVLSLGMSLLLGQMTYAEQAKLTIDFMLGAMQISLILFSVFMGISLFQRETAMGSISMILSKPVSRTSYLVGKFGGQIFIQIVLGVAMAGLTILVCSKFGTVPRRAIAQTSMLIVLESTVLASVAYFFAVNSGAVTSAIATLCVFAFGHMRDTIGKTLTKADSETAWQWVRGIIPDLEVFNTKALATYGLTLGWSSTLWAVFYGVMCTVFFLSIASLCFEQKDIAT